ncbi:MAG: hypothetical protein Q8L53_05995 [Aestuariivirga sp.]|nr:hypothetical protein [Aestuariivirga sp.]
MRRLLGSTSAVSIILSLAILGPPVAAAGQPATDYSQLVVRFNPKRDPGKPAYTVADCFGIDHCLTILTEKLLQAGGNAGLIAGAKEERQPDVSGEESIYRFNAPEGESFCKAFLLKLSAAPSSGAFTPALKFSASRKAVLAAVRLPASEGAPPRAWFDGILILFSVRDAAFAESSCSLTETAHETACKGNCQSIGF